MGLGRAFLSFSRIGPSARFRRPCRRGPIFNRDLAGLRQDRAAIGDDLFGEPLVVVDLDAEMVDRRPRPDQLGFRILLAVVDHQREVDIAVRQMARDVAARTPGADLAKPEHVFIEFRRRLEVGDLQCNMVDPWHGSFLFAAARI